jgi:hypothetical protein
LDVPITRKAHTDFADVDGSIGSIDYSYQLNWRLSLQAPMGFLVWIPAEQTSTQSAEAIFSAGKYG